MNDRSERLSTEKERQGHWQQHLIFDIKSNAKTTRKRVQGLVEQRLAFSFNIKGAVAVYVHAWI